MKVSRLMDLIAEDNRFLFTFIAVLSLVLVWINFSIGSTVIGVASGLPYLLINIVFIGNLFFSNELQLFKLFYGFLLFFSLIIVLGTFFYWFFVNFSNLSFFRVLAILTVSFAFLNKLSWGKVQNRNDHTGYLKSDLKRDIISSFGILDFFVVVSIILSFYFLFTVRTGESIIILDNIPVGFYLSYFSACLFALIKTFQNRVHPTVNVEDVEEEVKGIDIALKAKEHHIKAALSNSFGFGGHNSALIFAPYSL